MKEQIKLLNVQYLSMSHNRSYTLAFCIDPHVCTVSKHIGRYETYRSMGTELILINIAGVV